ncbi:hypothetical protein ELE36_06450 [Pseudolysobacter antarcticus]|uniref:Uncharacterized protein n=1 Tax=Pseudolysobacter antarcticus TaxID=2511995 RepID=A0A411HHN3_9GAMM|nr:hypothetical protein [Pseudolysobacter antarcticus]QBB70029.1 hypothetical protein ELE36_06450 [Pseudolysobacter antarcticus]
MQNFLRWCSPSAISQANQKLVRQVQHCRLYLAAGKTIRGKTEREDRSLADRQTRIEKAQGWIAAFFPRAHQAVFDLFDAIDIDV